MRRALSTDGRWPAFSFSTPDGTWWCDFAQVPRRPCPACKGGGESKKWKTVTEYHDRDYRRRWPITSVVPAPSVSCWKCRGRGFVLTDTCPPMGANCITDEIAEQLDFPTGDLPL